MQHTSKWITRLCALGVVISMMTPIGSGIAFADDKYRDHAWKEYDRHGHKHKHRHHKKYHHRKQHHRKHHKHHRILHHGNVYVVPEKRVRRYRDVVVVRPHGHWYRGYGHRRVDSDAYKWLAFTAITLKILDNLNEQQQREHESAQVRAASAPIGERIAWREGNVSGAVTATREGTSTAGRYCREFLQEVTIGGKTEQVYGTACRQADESWEIISTAAR